MPIAPASLQLPEVPLAVSMLVPCLANVLRHACSSSLSAACIRKCIKVSFRMIPPVRVMFAAACSDQSQDALPAGSARTQVACACSIASVEHLLSALEAMGVDNARIEYESGSEIPVLDGSAQPW